jgi:hypothetical protein
MTLTAKLDDLGKPAWIALTILGFIIWWPVGLATLVFLIWSGRMGCGQHSDSRWQSKMQRFCGGLRPGGGWGQGRSSGNHAFDDYRAETLSRLEEEQREFHEFLGRLRMAKDKAEFDQFMAERRNRPADEVPQAAT